MLRRATAVEAGMVGCRGRKVGDFLKIVDRATGGLPCPLKWGIGDQLIGQSGPESMRNSKHV
jgi:hypothetical protein